MPPCRAALRGWLRAVGRRRAEGVDVPCTALDWGPAGVRLGPAWECAPGKTIHMKRSLEWTEGPCTVPPTPGESPSQSLSPPSACACPCFLGFSPSAPPSSPLAPSSFPIARPLENLWIGSSCPLFLPPSRGWLSRVDLYPCRSSRSLSRAMLDVVAPSRDHQTLHASSSTSSS